MAGSGNWRPDSVFDSWIWYSTAGSGFWRPDLVFEGRIRYSTSRSGIWHPDPLFDVRIWYSIAGSGFRCPDPIFYVRIWYPKSLVSIFCCNKKEFFIKFQPPRQPATGSFVPYFSGQQRSCTKTEWEPKWAEKVSSARMRRPKSSRGRGRTTVKA
jgi:hypothetical protein